MKPLRDPERSELTHLIAYCQLDGKFVLEIGCGDGEFTHQYAHLAHWVVGIDPLASELQIASSKTRAARAVFFQGQAESLPFPPKTFDVAVFASSL